MSLSAEADKVENLEFKWGKKRGVGGKKKEVQFYDSFTYDGVDYILHDCVYMYKEGEPKPYIGKLIKIWENGDKTKKVKVQWFFHPSEILNWLRGEEALPNEIFLASGEGAGVANVNPLEAIAGKCNVVCISKDSRNPQPSEQEIRMADYIFYRTFDVRHCTISDKMDDKVGGLEGILPAKMVQRTAISSPHSGQAFVILKTKGAAERIIKELGDGCLMLSNGRPLVGSMAPPPSFLGKQSTFTGHLFVDKSKHQMQREMKEAVSTSHCSQPNTIEYEMAMEWRLLQSRSDRWWKLLYKRQGEELRKLKSNLKLK
ncbi:Protein ANTI-SILENCING 1 [Camellia lanceoleosa]|uniref:Protein ANTI-SILENCING 1 n=1 Tax=Camellia lanceoleosa TaxID=1840588 RepID=A0ACC0FZX4_9ERIC|nr:Protein ANTI-SILENCING 1 [Camellia lanceoleosa]